MVATLSDLKQQVLLRAADKRTRTILELLLQTGMSITELVSLRTDALRATTLRVQGRTYTLSPSLSQELGQAQGPFLFMGRQSQLTTRRVQQLLAQLQQTTHTDASPTTLRYTAIKRFVQAGLSVEQLQTQTGLGLLRAKQLHAAFSPQQLHTPKPRTPRAEKIVHTIEQTGHTLRDLVRLQHADGTYVFPSRTGSHITERRAQQILRTEANTTPHQLREAFFAKQLAQGTTPEQLASTHHISLQWARKLSEKFMEVKP